MELSIFQMRVFQFICSFAQENGFPPSYSDIAGHFGFSSTATVRTYLEQLEKKGFIQRLGKARGIRLLRGAKPQSIPIVGKIAAGSPTLAAENHEGTLDDLHELRISPGRYALKVEGDSMKDAGILDGDLAIIQRDSHVENGQIAAVLVDEHATLKRVFFEKQRIRLHSENENYAPMFLKTKDFESASLGKFIALVRKVGV